MGPEDPTSPYDTAIADVETRIRSMQNALETLKQLRASALGEPAPSPGGASRSTESEVQHDTFFGMTIGDAAQKYLTMTRVTKSTADIAMALERGGLKHSSKDFNTTVRSVLGQRKDFLRVPNGDWGLSEWYPGMGRGKKGKTEKPSKAKAKRKTPRSGKKLNLSDRIVEVMKTDPGKDWISTEVVAAIGGQKDSIQSTLSRMAKEGKQIVKAEKGYRLQKSEAVV